MIKRATGKRPEVIPAAVSTLLDDLRGFRHVFRVLYGQDLRPEELVEKFERVVDIIHPELKGSLQRLAAHLGAPQDRPSDPFT